MTDTETIVLIGGPYDGAEATLQQSAELIRTCPMGKDGYPQQPPKYAYYQNTWKRDAEGRLKFKHEGMR